MSVRMVPAEVVTASPLTIRIGGSGDPVSALQIAGQSLTPPDRGIALILPGALPIFIETV